VSGEDNPMMIFVKSDLIFKSFIKGIFLISFLVR
jgi:hypothetical protein